MQIPGYYFDPDRNKYFKITPDGKSIPSSTKYSASNVQTLLSKPLVSTRSSLPSLLSLRQSGSLNKSNYKAKLSLLRFKNISKFKSFNFESTISLVSCCASLIVLATTSGTLHFIWTDYDQIKAIKISKDDDITSISTRSINDKIYVSVTMLSGSLVLIVADKELNNNYLRPLFQTNFYGQESAWSSSLSDSMTSFGGSGSTLIVSHSNLKKTRLKFNLKSDVFSQCFGSESVLFSGCRNGAVWKSDLVSKTSTNVWNHDSAVTCIQKITENTFLTSSMNGKLLVWDSRIDKVVNEFHGNYNSYSRSSVTVDDGYILCCGEDGTSRVWCLFSGCKVLERKGVYGNVITRSGNGDLIITDDCEIGFFR